MGEIADVFDIIKKGPAMVKKLGPYAMNTKSVMRGARDATFQFPCLIVNTIPIDMASTIARYIEKNYVVATSQWISLNPYIDITRDRNIVQYLKKFHQNVALESVVNELMVKENQVDEYLEKVERGEYLLITNESKTYGLLINTLDEPTMEMYESHKDLIREHLSEFDSNPFPYVGEKVLTEADEPESTVNTSADLARAIIASRMKQQNDMDRDQSLKQTDRLRSPQLNDKDVKKTNDMAPYTINVRLMAVNDKNEFVQYMDFVLGVKVILHPVSSDETMESINRVMRNQNPLFKFIRWTSGEISLVKNLILNLDEIKDEVINRASGKNPYISRLRRLKQKRIGLHDITVPHALIPNSTLVLSSYEVEYLKNTNSIDVSDPRIARKLIDSMFLMTFVIVDDISKTVEVMYDYSTSFETYALETLEREVSLNSNSLGREIGRMISR